MGRGATQKKTLISQLENNINLMQYYASSSNNSVASLISPDCL